ncbi:MAG TPA: ATP-binding protein [Phycisphaerales bacterium]|nr:ATP-binding protein [Phycisphaerales bacterium]
MPALLGFGLGALCAAAAAWLTVRRYVRSMRAAERRARAAEQMAEIGAMTGGLAHEIKNPLSTIGLNAQLLTEALEESALPDEERARLLGRAGALRREAERLRDILADFLEFAGRVHLEPVRTDLNVLIDELADFFLPEAEGQGVRLRVQLAPTPLVCDLDTKLMKQALLNLLLNATQAMSSPECRQSPRACELLVRTRQVREADGALAAAVHVTDTGPGMDRATLARIFTPYFTTKSGGSGLGLPMARRLIQEHGGRLDVHSEPGRGSDFVVVLPLAPRNAGPARAGDR